MFPDYSLIRTDILHARYLEQRNIRLAVLRLDLLHPFISGNKWFKLKYNLQEAGCAGSTILTFGGAWSNHLSATALACSMLGFRSIGVVRGERPVSPSLTLQEAQEAGMQLHFISRSDYRQRQEPAFLSALQEYFREPLYIIPEGGCNEQGVKGCEEILDHVSKKTYSHICCACGTGTTLAGLIRSALPEQEILGFAAAGRDEDIEGIVRPYLLAVHKAKWSINTDYRFGGFARVTPLLLDFMNDFYREHHIPLDIVYTGKLMAGISDLVRKDYFPRGSSILAIHTGGLQGNRSLPAGRLIYGLQ